MQLDTYSHETVADRCGAVRNWAPYVMLLPKPEERRRAPRYRLARLATILPGNGAAPRYCLVTDIADGGVRIDLNQNLRLSEEFMLRFSGDAPAQNGTYRLIWQRGWEVGAEFLKRDRPGFSLLKSFSNPQI